MNKASTPDTRKGLRVAIVGGGASGTFLALQLAARGIAADIFDASGAFGRGLAYSATAPWHRLNVPIEKIGSAEKADGESFSEWYGRTRQPAFAAYADRFVPREAYGQWLSGQLDAAVASGLTRLHRTCVVGMTAEPGGVVIEPEDRGPHRADVAVLCLGNHPPRPLGGAPARRFVNDIWAPPGLAQVGPDEPVLIVGTGATAIDAVLDLLHRGHAAPIHLVSRRALMPLVDVPPEGYAPEARFEAETSARRIFRVLRDEVARAETQGALWQNVIDGFRPFIEGIWERLSEAEKRRFLRHLRPVWLVHRHRLAPDIAARIASLRAEGRVTLIQGRLANVETSERGHTVAIRLRGGGERTVRAGWLVNCTGPEEDYRRIDVPLIRNLLGSGTVRPGDLGVGLDVDRECRLIAADGSVQQRLFALGVATRMRFGEVTSAPQIRTRAVTVANAIADLAARA